MRLITFTILKDDNNVSSQTFVSSEVVAIPAVFFQSEVTKIIPKVKCPSSRLYSRESLQLWANEKNLDDILRDDFVVYDSLGNIVKIGRNL
jgi:hypothetical protein